MCKPVEFTPNNGREGDWATRSAGTIDGLLVRVRFAWDCCQSSGRHASTRLDHATAFFVLNFFSALKFNINKYKTVTNKMKLQGNFQKFLLHQILPQFRPQIARTDTNYAHSYSVKKAG